MTGRIQLAAQIELITSARGGDHAAIVSLLAASQPDIRRYALMNCRIADVDDAVQDVLWLLYRRIGALRVAASFSAWLFQVVRRECQRLARRSFGGHITLDTIENDLAFSERPAVELRSDLASAIQSLPDHYRTIVVMRDIEELTVNEIAAATCLTREAVKARLHRARALIREYLSG